MLSERDNQLHHVPRYTCFPAWLQNFQESRVLKIPRKFYQPFYNSVHLLVTPDFMAGQHLKDHPCGTHLYNLFTYLVSQL